MTLRLILLALPCSILLAACAGSPSTRYYTLAEQNSPTEAQGVAPRGTTTLSIGPVTVPESLDRLQMVARIGPNELHVSDEHRWAQPLRLEVARAVSLNLARRMPEAQVSTYTEAAASDTDYRLSLDLQRVEATLGGAVAIEAQWSLRTRSGAKVRAGHSTARAEARAADYQALAAAYARALETIAGDIVSATAPLGHPETR